MRVVSFFLGIVATIVTIMIGASVGGWYLVRPVGLGKDFFSHYKGDQFFCVNVEKL